MAERWLQKFATTLFPGTGALFAPPAIKEPSRKQLQTAEAYVDPSRLLAGWVLQPYNPSWLVTRKGLQIYDQMRRDEQVKAALKFKKDSVLAAGWEIVSPADEDEDWEVTRFVRASLTYVQDGWHTVLMNMLSALDYGYAISEKVYAEAETGEWQGKLILSRVQSLKPHYLDFIADEYGQLLGVLQQSPAVKHLAPGKLVYYTYNREFGNYYGVSDLESAYRPFWVKENTYKWLAVALERYGMPPLFALYDPIYYQGNQIEELKKVVKNIQNATFGVLPRGAKDALEFWSQQLGRESSNIFLTSLQRFDEHIARAILVPGMLGVSADEGKIGSLARSQTHQESFLRVIAQLQQDIAVTVMNAQVIPQLCDLNWPSLASYPQFRFLPFRDEQRLEIIKTWGALVGERIVSRIEDDESHIRKALGFPENDAPVLEPLPTDAAAKAKGEEKEVPEEEQTEEMRAFAEEHGAVWIEMGGERVAVNAGEWDETKHPRHPKGSSNRGGEFAPKTIDPMTLRASEINKELDRLDSESSKLTSAMISAGRGTEPIQDTLRKDDPLSLQIRAVSDRQHMLRQEIAARYGPSAPSRLPTWERGRFGPRG